MRDSNSTQTLCRTLTKAPTQSVEKEEREVLRVAVSDAMWNSAENAFARSASFREQGDDEEALRWAALERLPTYKRARRGIFKNLIGDMKEIDVRELQSQEQRLLLERLTDNDPETFFHRMRSRFDA